MSFGITELIIILVIVLLLFGTTRLKSLGSDLGAAIKGFRSAVTDDADKNTEKKEAISDSESGLQDSGSGDQSNSQNGTDSTKN